MTVFFSGISISFFLASVILNNFSINFVYTFLFNGLWFIAGFDSIFSLLVISLVLYSFSSSLNASSSWAKFVSGLMLSLSNIFCWLLKSWLLWIFIIIFPLSLLKISLTLSLLLIWLFEFCKEFSFFSSDSSWSFFSSSFSPFSPFSALISIEISSSSFSSFCSGLLLLIVLIVLIFSLFWAWFKSTNLIGDIDFPNNWKLLL